MVSNNGAIEMHWKLATRGRDSVILAKPSLSTGANSANLKTPLCFPCCKSQAPTRDSKGPVYAQPEQSQGAAESDTHVALSPQQSISLRSGTLYQG